MASPAQQDRLMHQPRNAHLVRAARARNEKEKQVFLDLLRNGDRHTEQVGAGDKEKHKSQTGTVNEAVAKMFITGKYADLTILCKGLTKFQAHKSIVCTRSGFFENALKRGTMEHDTSTISFREDEAVIVYMALSYIYTDTFSPTSARKKYVQDAKETGKHSPLVLYARLGEFADRLLLKELTAATLSGLRRYLASYNWRQEGLFEDIDALYSPNVVDQDSPVVKQSRRIFASALRDNNPVAQQTESEQRRLLAYPELLLDMLASLEARAGTGSPAAWTLLAQFWG